MRSAVRSLLSLAMLALALVFAVGCDSGEPVPTLGGTYVTFIDGSLISDQLPPGSIVELSARIPETEAGAFGFSGDLSVNLFGGTLSYDFGGVGTYSHPNVTMDLTLAPPLSQTYVLAGVASEDRGTLTMSDEEGRFVTLRRE